MDATPFSPGATTQLTSTSTTGATALPKTANQQVLVQNASAVVIFVQFGASDVAATTNASTPILANSGRIFTVGPGATHVAAISASTALAYFTGGRGA